MVTVFPVTWRVLWLKFINVDVAERQQRRSRHFCPHTIKWGGTVSLPPPLRICFRFVCQKNYAKILQSEFPWKGRRDMGSERVRQILALIQIKRQIQESLNSFLQNFTVSIISQGIMDGWNMRLGSRDWYLWLCALQCRLVEFKGNCCLRLWDRTLQYVGRKQTFGCDSAIVHGPVVNLRSHLKAPAGRFSAVKCLKGNRP